MLKETPTLLASFWLSAAQSVADIANKHLDLMHKYVAELGLSPVHPAASTGAGQRSSAFRDRRDLLAEDARRLPRNERSCTSRALRSRAIHRNQWSPRGDPSPYTRSFTLFTGLALMILRAQ